MSENMSDLQKKLLEMFKWFHQFCVDNGLRYYALGGTMLGAVRHNGFIPWDDDIDVGMPRRDYIRFIELCKGKSFGKYIIETVDTEKLDYFYGYIKIYDTSTTLIEKTRFNIKRGIYIDLFPLDGVGDADSDIPAVFNPIFKKYQLLVARTCALSTRRKFYKNAAVILARLLPDVLVNNKKLLLEIDSLCSKRDFDDCSIIGNLLGNWGIKEIMPKEILGSPTLYSFEDTVIFGAEQYDRYLNKLYGDWHILPPEEKRVSHHDCVLCDLNKSFLE